MPHDLLARQAPLPIADQPFVPSPLRHPAVRRHEAAWHRLRQRPDALQRAAEWAIVDAELTSLDQLLLATGYDQPDRPEFDTSLRRLLAVAATDPLAAEVVVRRLLPGALSLAARRRRAHPDALDELLGALWIAVRTFDLSRRPSSLAAALLSDADYRAFRAHTRRRFVEEPHDDLGERAARMSPGDVDEAIELPGAVLADLIAGAARRGALDVADLELARVLVSEPDQRGIARRLNVSERTVRNRRARLTAKLRAVARDAA